MSNRLNDINTKLLAVVAGINATGTYTYDLSTTGRVFLASGRPDAAPDLCVWLVQGEVECEPAGHGNGAASKHRWTVSYAVNGFTPATEDSPAARISAANVLYQDLFYAIVHQNRHLNDGSRNLVNEVNVSQMVALDGADVGFAGLGVVSFVLTYTFEATTLA